jgi:hypothetical protein
LTMRDPIWVDLEDANDYLHLLVVHFECSNRSNCWTFTFYQSS